MKKNLILMSFLALSIFALGQAYESILPQVETKKTNREAAKITLPYSPAVVVEALNSFVLLKGKAEKRKTKGYDLTENTLLEMNNTSGVDMHFFVTLTETDNPNVTDLYLELASSTTNNEDNGILHYFDMQDAKAYLDNLEMAITKVASDLQLKLQHKNLTTSKANSLRLEGEAVQLQKKKQNLKRAIDKDYASKKYDRLLHRLDVINQKIDKNIIYQANQRVETLKQGNALMLLVNRLKA